MTTWRIRWTRGWIYEKEERNKIAWKISRGKRQWTNTRTHEPSFLLWISPMDPSQKKVTMLPFSYEKASDKIPYTTKIGSSYTCNTILAHIKWIRIYIKTKMSYSNSIYTFISLPINENCSLKGFYHNFLERSNGENKNWNQ